ncbi:MAG TPA: GNAT family N-acetyltransferase [Rhizomicrobium sp.]|jgi:GNAT superfamily N-acetyltransferase
MGKVTQSYQFKEPVPLSPDLILDEFDCGVPALNIWLKLRARRNEAAGASRTFVIAKSDRSVVGYYSLAAASILHEQATGRVKRNMPEPVPAVLIGRLALDRRIQGKGNGIGLLRDAVLRIVAAAETVGIRAILVHAMSEDAKRFYEHFGFRVSPLAPMTLMMTIDEVRRQVGSPKSGAHHEG